MCLSNLCINQLEMNIIDNIKYVFIFHYDRVWVIIRTNIKINTFIIDE